MERRHCRLTSFLTTAIIVAIARAIGSVSQEADPIPSWSPPTVNDVALGLENLPFGTFLDDSCRLYLLRYLEDVTRNGFESVVGEKNDRDNDYSPSYRQETEAIGFLILTIWQRYDRFALSYHEQCIKRPWTRAVGKQINKEPR